MPRVCIIETDEPNAFATGRNPEHAAVAVTTGIMRALNYEELAGVISHELAHVKHRDILISTIAASMAGAISMIANVAQFGAIFGSSNNDDEEGNFTVNFSSDNKLTIYEYYRDYETDEWYESTVELVEKNPSESNGEEGDITVPTDKTPVERVFTGKLVDEVDDHGLDKFIYENGFLTQVLSGGSDEYRITFEYNYLNPNKSASDPDVRYTNERADGSVSYVYDVWLNELGFAERIDSKHYDDYGGFDFQSTCEYDEEGHLVYMNEGREEREYSLTWTDGDLVCVDRLNHNHTTNFTYSEMSNDNNLMFFYDIYDMDLEELKYLYWAGLLGVSPKHLVASSYIHSDGYDHSYEEYKWEADKVLSKDDGESDWTEEILFSFAE